MDVKYTQIPNDILEAKYKGEFSKRQHKLMDLILRYTYGFHEEFLNKSLTWISKEIGVAKPHVSTTLKELVSRRVVTKTVTGVTKTVTFSPKSLKINPNVGEWGGVTKTVTSYQNSNTPVTKTVISPSIKETTTKRKTTNPRSGEKKKTKSLVPDNFQPSKNLIDWAYKKYNIDSIPALTDQTERFIDYHKAKGTKHIDWEAAWRLWTRNWITDFGKVVITPPDPNKPRPEDHPNHRGYNPDDYPDG